MPLISSIELPPIDRAKTVVVLHDDPDHIADRQNAVTARAVLNQPSHVPEVAIRDAVERGARATNPVPRAVERSPLDLRSSSASRCGT
jgi:hypothetical protein